MARVSAGGAGTILSKDHAATTALVSDDFAARGGHPEHGVVLYIYSTIGGTAVVAYVDERGAARTLETLTIVANVLSIKDYDYHIPQFRVTFTPTSATAGHTDIEAYAYGGGR